MRKSTKLLKRFAALFLLVLLSCESFAAVIGDDDGAAFITKGEFDNLKKEFDKQISKYNKSLGNKIDGAIANYLNGIRVSNITSGKLFYAGWDSVTSMNYAPNNEFWWPNLSANYTMGASTARSSPLWSMGWWAYMNMSYSRPSGRTSKRLLVDAGEEKGSNFPDNVYWVGRAVNYLDTITVTRSVMNSDRTNVGGNLQGAGEGSSAMHAIRVLSFTPGYYPNIATEKSSFWNPNFYWVSTTDTSYNGERTQSSFEGYTNAATIELGALTDSEGNLYTKDYEHILIWNDLSFPQVSDTDWNSSFRNIVTGTSATFTRKDFADACSKSGQWSCTMANTTTTGDSGGRNVRRVSLTNHSGYWTGAYNAHDNTNMVSAGIVNKTYSAKDIYQTNTKFSQVVENSEYTLEKQSLRDGLVCFAANEGDKIKWELKFDNMYVDGSLQAFDIDVVLATTPFKDGINIDTTKGVYITWKEKVGDVEVEKHIKTTDAEHKCKFEIEMPEGAIVYCKWYPHDTSLQSRAWEASLDLKNYGTYYRTPA